MKIPKSFELAGAKWSVVQLPAVVDKESGVCLGLTHRDKLLIEIQEDLPQTIKETTFLHELCHSIKFTMGQQDHDEVEVDAFAQLLHQYLKTAR